MSVNKPKVEDFLEVDQPVPGQNYACISFVSPEDVIVNKNIYFAHKYLQSIGKEYGLSIKECGEKYKDFLYSKQDDLEKEYYEQNDYQTTVRGLKIRGVYDTLKEAQSKAGVLQRKDPHFNVFIGQVGYWLPWDPNAHKVDKQEYAESELNTMVQKYRENHDMKDAHFRENIEYVKEQAALQNEKKKKENAEQAALDAALDIIASKEEVRVNQPEVTPDNIVDPLYSEEDPWMKVKDLSSK